MRGPSRRNTTPLHVLWVVDDRALVGIATLDDVVATTGEMRDVVATVIE